jgi:N-acetylmuramoyl-L-alanine amidase
MIFLTSKILKMIHKRLNQIKRIVLSIGHDKKNVGAMNVKGEQENVLVTDIAEKTKCFLEKNGVNVLLLPDIDLSTTIKNLNKECDTFSDLAIEIHKDSCGDLYNDHKMYRRVGLYYMESDGSMSIASQMIKSMMVSGAHNTSWVRIDTDSPRKRLAFVRDTKMLSYIYEAGFIEGSNTNEENEWYAWALARSILLVLEKPVHFIPENMTTNLPND